MDKKLLKDLLKNETDVDGTLKRLSGDEKLYASLLGSFVHDNTMFDLDSAIKTKSWDDAFTAAHALKGLAGNMGFIPLFHSTGELVMIIRAGRIQEIDSSLNSVKHCYEQIVKAIKDNHLDTQGGIV